MQLYRSTALMKSVFGLQYNYPTSPNPSFVRRGFLNEGIDKMTEIFNLNSQKIKRQILRKSMPPAEIILWLKLNRKQLRGYKFRRQYSVGRFVIDFYCPKVKLAIEIDGTSHLGGDAKKYDKERQDFVESLDINFLRFTNTEIHKNLDDVMSKIKEWLP